MRKKILLIFTLSLFHSFQAYPQNKSKFSPDNVKTDLKYLYETLEASHYNLFVNTPKKIFDSEFTRITGLVHDSLTLLQVHRLFQPFTALAKLGHCNTTFPFNDAYVPFVMGGGKVFPMDVFIKDRHVWIKDNYTEDSRIQRGDEILAINEMSANHWLDEIYRYLSGENEMYKNTSIDLIKFPRLFWIVFGERNTFLIKIKKPNEKKLTVDLNSIPALSYENKASAKPSLLNANREFKFIGDIAYLHPGQFLNVTGGNNTVAFETGEFLAFIDSSFVQIHGRKTKNIIIDLRGNPGGDNSFSDPLIAYFANRPFSFSSSFRVKTSKLTKEFWQDVSDTLLNDLKQKILTMKDGEIFEAPIKKYPPRTDSLKFDGRVYVLINRYSYSNAATTAAIVQDYKFGVLMGEQTADSPTLYAAVHQFKLPNTQIEVTYPKAFIIRPNGNLALKGVSPDVPLNENIFTQEDEILNGAIQYIKEKK